MWVIKLLKKLIQRLLKEHIALCKIVLNDGIHTKNNMPVIQSRCLKLTNV